MSLSQITLLCLSHFSSSAILYSCSNHAFLKVSISITAAWWNGVSSSSSSSIIIVIIIIIIVIINYHRHLLFWKRRFFHAKLGSDVCPRVDNQTYGDTLQNSTQPLTSGKIAISLLSTQEFWSEFLVVGCIMPFHINQFGLGKRQGRSQGFEKGSSIFEGGG